ncbi:MAG TPA: BtrH N-terminal domain-containing protein [Saprospiraceae bacterium]|nr:BtrH N-terminal domain-containing protein [Saprospiraceae bacterium]HQW56154.1 BtrH N-terminal domain-containing protein [Saprospiraceae bacterium]
MPFTHKQTAHCETGVTQGLLREIGWEISEPMLFGIGSGLHFIHIPFLKVNGVPATSYRIWPGGIFNRVTKLLRLEASTFTFKDPIKANNALDEQLAQGRAVGVMGSVYYLSYMPDAYRFHFNAHNLLVVGKDGDDYIVSDPILEELKTISANDLAQSRFAKGYPAPNGKMYYIKGVEGRPIPNLETAVKKGIKRTIFLITSPPFKFAGVSGIAYLGNRIKTYPQKMEPRKALLALGNIVRMQEEIGTGGGGFRFMYGAFLDEASQMLNNPDLKEMSLRITNIGDDWRNFAFETAKVIKSRSGRIDSFDYIGNLLIDIGCKEEQFYKDLGKVKL